MENSLEEKERAWFQDSKGIDKGGDTKGTGARCYVFAKMGWKEEGVPLARVLVSQ